MSEENFASESTTSIQKKIKVKCKKKKKRYFSALESLQSLDSSITLNQSQTDQIRLLSNENEALQKCCFEQLAQIKCLTKQADDLNDIINVNHISIVGRGSNAISSKIIELSKRNRSLCSELGSYKLKCQNYENEVAKLRQKIEDKPAEPEQILPSPIDPSEIDALKTELGQVKCKLFDALNQNAALKNEVRHMQKCVQQEIGSENLHSSGGWKSRAQQILALQARVTELTKQLDGNSMSDKTQQAKLEFNRKQEVDNLQKECVRLNEIVDSQQKKVTALKVRNQNLAAESTAYKLKLDELCEKCKENNSYIEALKKQISTQKTEYDSQVKNLIARMANLETVKESFNHELSKVHLMIDNKEKIIEGKGSRIQELESKLTEMQAELRDTYGDFLFKCRDLCRGQYLSILDNLESEKCQVLVQFEICNSKLKQEIENNQKLQTLIGKQRIKTSKLEANILKINQNKERSTPQRARGTQLQNTNAKDESPEMELVGLKMEVELYGERIRVLEAKLKEVLDERETSISELSKIIKNSKEFITEIINGKVDGNSLDKN